MTDDEIRALADQLEAHAASYVHAHATERLLRQAAAALTALAAERDAAREELKCAREVSENIRKAANEAANVGKRFGLARAREIAESVMRNGAPYSAAKRIAAAIEAEMRSDEAQHSVKPLTKD